MSCPGGGLTSAPAEHSEEKRGKAPPEIFHAAYVVRIDPMHFG